MEKKDKETAEKEKVDWREEKRLGARGEVTAARQGDKDR